jgi:phosphopantetheine adenylyltransferase
MIWWLIAYATVGLLISAPVLPGTFDALRHGHTRDFLIGVTFMLGSALVCVLFCLVLLAGWIK